MRILIWGNCFPKMGGVERFVDNLAKELAKRGHDICVICDGEESESRQQDGYKVAAFPATAAQLANDPFQLLEVAQKIRKHIDGWQPDVIHFQRTGYHLFIFSMVARKVLPPYVITMHDECAIYKKSLPMEQAHRGAGAVTAVSSYIKEKSSYPLPVKTIINALPAKEKIANYPAEKRIFALGRQQVEKGFETLIKAMPAILAGHPDARLTLAGKGEQNAALVTLAQDLGLSHAIDFPGWVHPDNVHQNMSDAAMVIMPSHWQEPFGLVALEAAWASRPCIASRVGGLQDIVIDSETGLLVEPANPQALSAAVISLLDDPARAATMGLAARRRAETAYSFEQMVDSYFNIYEEIAQTSN